LHGFQTDLVGPLRAVKNGGAVCSNRDWVAKVLGGCALTWIINVSLAVFARFTVNDNPVRTRVIDDIKLLLIRSEEERTVVHETIAIVLQSNTFLLLSKPFLLVLLRALLALFKLRHSVIKLLSARVLAPNPLRDLLAEPFLRYKGLCPVNIVAVLVVLCLLHVQPDSMPLTLVKVLSFSGN